MVTHSCRSCAANWSEGAFGEGCAECGGGAMEVDCPWCAGQCGQIWTRAVMDSQDRRRAHWNGKCAGGAELREQEIMNYLEEMRAERRAAPGVSAPLSAARSPRLYRVRAFFFGSVALAFPVAALCVFGLGADRGRTADVLSVIYCVGLFAAVFSSFLPIAELAEWGREARIRSAALAFLGMSYATHLSWELGWLVLREEISAQRDSAWAYAWWAYIDGGDARYAHGEPLLVGMELLSVCNGLVGALALRRYFRVPRAERSGPRVTGPVAVMGGTAVVHLYSASLYYLSEILAGLPNVGDGFVSLYIKFGLANSLWVVAPFLVFHFCRSVLGSSKLGATQERPAA